MIGKFEKLFSVRLLHEFYIDRKCNDFEFQPTSACQKSLDGHGLLFISCSNGFDVLFKQIDDQNTPFIIIDVDIDFSFVIKSINNHFLGFTKIPKSRNGVFYFSNRGVDVKLKEIILDKTKFPVDNNLLHYYGDHRVISERILNIDDLKHRNNVFGFINIHNSEIVDQKSIVYNIAFETGKGVWKYYVLLQENDKSEFFIEAKDTYQNGNNRYASINFSFGQHSNSERINGRKALLFESVTESTGVFDVDGHVIVGTENPAVITEPKRISVPNFEEYSISDSRNAYVRKGTTRRLTGSTYNRIIIREDATVIFTQPEIDVMEVKIIKGRATIKFEKNAKLKIGNKIELTAGSAFNPDGLDVICFVGSLDSSSNYINITIHQGVSVIATMFTFGQLQLISDSQNDGELIPVMMKGIFIAGHIVQETETQWILKKNNWGVPTDSPSMERVELPFYEENAKNLQLIKTNDQEEREVLIDGLPNPSMNHLGSEVFINL